MYAAVVFVSLRTLICQRFSVPASRVRVSDGVGLFNVLLEMPAPPWVS